jgi:hypothetical protein
MGAALSITMRILVLAALAAVLHSAPASGLALHNSADTIRIANQRIRIAFDRARGDLIELRETRTGQNFTVGAAAPGQIWLLDLPAGSARPTLSPGDARQFRAYPEANGLGARLEWSDFGVSDAPELKVMVRVRTQGGVPMTSWRIALTGLGKLGVEQVRFPRITGIPPLGPGEELAVPRWMGQRARDPRAQFIGQNGQGRRQEWAYPGTLSLQALALYRPGGAGLYFAADDTLAYRKTFALWGDGQRNISYEVVQALPDPASPRDTWQPSFSAVIGTFEGDWLTAVGVTGCGAHASAGPAIAG